MSREILESRKENSIMYGVTLATANTVKTMNNNDMGSKVNRVKCTGEHVKNDIISGQIDQKYIDNAKLEKMTNSVIV